MTVGIKAPPGHAALLETILLSKRDLCSISMAACLVAGFSALLTGSG